MPDPRVLGDRGEHEVDQVLDVDRPALRAVEQVQPLVAAQPGAPGQGQSARGSAGFAGSRNTEGSGAAGRGASNFVPAGIGGGTFIAAGRRR